MWNALWACAGSGVVEVPSTNHSVAPSTPTDAPLPGHTAEPPDGPPNLLLVILDDLGVDQLATYGDGNRRTPTLDRLATEGRRFDNAWGYPSCSPARTSTYTGRHARRHGFGSNVKAPDEYFFDPAEVTIAEVLRAAPVPYHTAMVGKWHLEESETAWVGPLAHGWQWYAGTPKNVMGDYWTWYKMDGHGVFAEHTGYLTTDTADDLAAVLRDTAEPWFVTAAFNAPHAPFHVPPPALVREGLSVNEQIDVRQQVLLMLEAWDTEFGRVLAGMDPDLRARTWIVIVGDNGDSITDDGFTFDGGKVSLMDGGVHVPMVVVGPGVSAPGTSSPALVSLVDLFPTFAALAGVDVSTLRDGRDPSTPLALDGASLLPALADPAAAIHQVILSEKFETTAPFTDYQVAARSRTHKLWIDVDGTQHLYVYDDPSTVDEPRELGPTERDASDFAAEEELRDAIRDHVAATPPR